MNREIERFSQKADLYRQALERSPKARVLETAYVSAIVVGHLDTLDVDVEDAIVVDVMSGSGYLCQRLRESGFRHIHAIEACNAMSANAEAYDKDVQLHTIQDIWEVGVILKKIAPHAAVSLASFHHLIEYHDCGSIDQQKSVALQQGILNLIVDSVREDGIVVVADLYDDTLESDSSWPSSMWNQRTFVRHVEQAFSKVEAARIGGLRRHPLQTTTETVQRLLTVGEHRHNPSLQWFRDVVDKRTTLGHSDVALSKTLVDAVRQRHKVSVAHLCCPWIFENDGELEDFLWLKFGFALDPSSQMTRKRVVAEAERVLGTAKWDGKTCLGWRLAAIAVRGKEVTPARWSRRAQILLLGVLNVVFVLAVYWKWRFGVEAGLSTAKMLENMIAILVGMVLGLWSERMIQRINT